MASIGWHGLSWSEEEEMFAAVDGGGDGGADGGGDRPRIICEVKANLSRKQGKFKEER